DIHAIGENVGTADGNGGAVSVAVNNAESIAGLGVAGDLHRQRASVPLPVTIGIAQRCGAVYLRGGIAFGVDEVTIIYRNYRCGVGYSGSLNREIKRIFVAIIGG